MSDSQRDLIKASADLARSAPESWRGFLGALRAYTDTQRDNIVSSPLDVLPVAQGRAQACVALLRLMEDCLQNADQIKERKR